MSRTVLRQLPSLAQGAFQSIFKLFTEILPGFKGTLYSTGIFKLLDKEMPKEILDEIGFRKLGSRPTEEVIFSEKGVIRKPFRKPPKPISQVREELLLKRPDPDTLFSQLKEWAEVELSPPEIVEHTWEGQVLYKEN